jgi:hypothetical protein
MSQDYTIPRYQEPVVQMEPTILRPFSDEVYLDLKNHVEQIRRLFEGHTPYHDHLEPDANRFNRWYWHDLPLLVELHNGREFVNMASKFFGEDVKPSYSFLSMYGKDGVCPPHTDRRQCRYTIDICLSQDKPWPINIKGKEITLQEGEAVAYSGTTHHHYRRPMNEYGGTFCNLAFFHFVPVAYTGDLK